ncbi:YjgF-like protein [Phlebopus sp. FC_14]|nr:YjgF-like protein [Phlebopus sp. FC_14]
MTKVAVNNIEGAVPALPTFSQAVISKGHVFVSGIIGCDEEYNIVGGIHDQTLAALNNMKKVLEGAGSGLEHVVKVTIFLTQMQRDFDVVNSLYKEFFQSQADAMPAKTLVGASSIPMGGFVQFDCIAEHPSE